MRENRNINFWYLLSTKYYLVLKTLEKSGFGAIRLKARPICGDLNMESIRVTAWAPLSNPSLSLCDLPTLTAWKSSPGHELARTGRLDWPQLSLSLDVVGPHENTCRYWCGARQTSQSEKQLGNSLLARFSPCSLNMSCKERGLRLIERGFRIGHGDPYNTCPEKSWLFIPFNRKADNLAQWTLICAYT